MCGIFTWDNTVDAILLISSTYGVVARAYSCFGAVATQHYNGTTQHARRRLGTIVNHSLDDDRLSGRLNGENVVYIIFSLWHHHRYIGSTTNFSRRCQEHYRAGSASRDIPLLQKGQRVHTAMRYFGPGWCGIIPLCTTKLCDLRLIEDTYIKRLQPTLNVRGTVHGGRLLQKQRVLQWKAERTKLQHPGYIASRLRTAHRHVMLTTLGIALPPSVGKLLMCKLNADMNAVLMEDVPNRVRRFQGHCSMIQDQYGFSKAFASVTMFAIATEYEVVTTSRIHLDWPALLSRCPKKLLVYGFCAITCVINVALRGTLRSRTSCKNIGVWSPMACTTLNNGKLAYISLQKAIRWLEDGRATSITTFFTSLALRGNPDTVLVMYDIGRNTSRAKWTLRDYSMVQVIELWKSRTIIRSTPWRSTVNGTLLKYMKDMWKFDPTRRPVIRIENNLIKNVKQKIGNLLHCILLDAPFENVFKVLFSERVRIIISAGKSIAQTLVNNISVSKLSSVNTPPCTCATICSIFKIDPPAFGNHVGIRGRSIHHGDAGDIFKVNAMSSLHTCMFDMEKFIVKTMMAMYGSITNWTGRRLRGDWKPEDMELILSIEAGYAAIPEWCCTSNVTDIISASVAIGTLPDSDTWNRISLFRKYTQEQIVMAAHRTSSSMPDVSTLNKLKARLGDSAVISTLDRNAGALFVECQVAYHEAMYKMFDHGENNVYQLVRRSATTIKNGWRQLGILAGVPGTFDTAGFIPYAYVNHKNKDTSRCRPIVSFARAPHRRQLKLCARAFYFIIRAVRDKHFTLWTAHDVRTPVLEATRLLRESSWTTDDAEIVAVASDIKDMYSNLGHEAIMDAVTWSISTFRRQFRRDRVNVQRRGQPKGRTGPTYDTTLRVEIQCDSLVRYISGLLPTCFFTCGSSTLQQRLGIPMGSHISPPLAIVTCMFFECKFIQQSTSVQRPLCGLRYMDDIIHMTLRRFGEPSFQREEDMKVNSTLLAARSIYPPAMRVIVTGAVTPFTFLETIMQWRGMYLQMDYANPNGAALKTTGHQEIQRFRHGRSMTQTASLREVLCCMLRRCSVFNTSLGQQICAVLGILNEFNSLQYNTKIQRGALHRLAQRDKQHRAFWELILYLV